MFNISTYLSKFKTLGMGEIASKELVLEVLREIVKVSLTRKEIKIQNKIAYIQTNPLVKNQIYIKKAAILESLLKKGQELKDIR